MDLLDDAAEFGDIDADIKDHERIVEVNEGEVQVLLGQGVMLSQLADVKRDAAIIQKNAEENPDDAPEGLDEPTQSVDELKADETKIREVALDAFSEAVELAPEKIEYYVIKAQAQIDLERNEDALATIDALLERDDKSLAGLRMKAQILLRNEENDDKTLKVLDRATKLDPYDMQTRRLRLSFFAARQQFSNATEEAKRIVEKEPRNSEMMNQLALLYAADEKPKKAIEIYGSLLRRIPVAALGQLPPRSRPFLLLQRLETLRSRGDAYLSTSEHEKAIEDYEEALELGDQIEEMQASLANPSVEYTPNDGVLNNLAWVLATSTNDELRDGDRAVDLATQACEVTDYKAPHILSTLAAAHAEVGDFDKAIQWIENGIEVNADREITERVTEEEIKRQRESLEKELDSYKQKKPWRENQVEEDAAKKKAEKKAKAKKKDDDSDDDSDEEKDSKDDKDSKDEDDDSDDEDKI